MDLHVLGWNAHWRDLFEPYLAKHLTAGRVVAEHRGAYRVETQTGDRAASLAGRLRHSSTRRSELPAVGDFVALRLSRDQDGPAIVEAVLPRRTSFVRRAAGRHSDDQVIAANVDTIFVVL